MNWYFCCRPTLFFFTILLFINVVMCYFSTRFFFPNTYLHHQDYLFLPPCLFFYCHKNYTGERRGHAHYACGTGEWRRVLCRLALLTQLIVGLIQWKTSIVIEWGIAPFLPSLYHNTFLASVTCNTTCTCNLDLIHTVRWMKIELRSGHSHILDCRKRAYHNLNRPGPVFRVKPTRKVE